MRYIGDAVVRNGFADSCHFLEEHNCSVLTCIFESSGYLTLGVLRCAHPPAIRVILGDGFDTYFDHTFHHSETVPLFNAVIKVTLDQLCPSDIGFQVSRLLINTYIHVHL